MNKVRIIFIVLFLLGAGVRAVDVWRPIDRPLWRECDIAAVARNFDREDMNLFYPRIDWRGDSPGYAEMELPIYPFLIAVGYRLFGFHEFIGRLIAYAFSLAALFVFFKLARYFLSTNGAIAASLFFVFSPLVVYVSHALQPEGFMLLYYVTAVYAFVRWLDDGTRKYFLLAIFATALTLLAKITAGHIGLLFAVLTLRKFGFAALRRKDIWLFAVVTLLSAMLWSYHSHHLWLTYGNSLGVSNEYHWIGWDFFTNSYFIRGILQNEISHVWMPFGLILAACAVLWRRNARVVNISLWWLAAIFVFYIIASRTTADDWAFYYHTFSAPPAALLIGAGVEATAGLFREKLLRKLILACSVLSLLTGVVGSVAFYWLHKTLSLKIAVVFGVTTLLLLVFQTTRSNETNQNSNVMPTQSGERHLTFARIISFALTFCFALTLLTEAREIVRDTKSWDDQRGLFMCAKMFAPAMTKPGLIVASGGACADADGYRVAYNSSYFFYWTERRGFNICEAEQSREKLLSFVPRGARYFIAEKKALKLKSGFETELRQNFPVRAECVEAILFELTDTNR